MRNYNIAILGATGAVGKEMLNVLGEQNFPINELKLLASKRSAGKEVIFKGQKYVIEEACKDAFKGMDIVLGAVENDLAQELLPHAVQAGALVIDNSSAYRLCEDVPLVIPEVNPHDILKHKGIIANPNCATIIALVAINKLHQFAQVDSMVVSTYQAVSGAGNSGITELETQVKQLMDGEEVRRSTFPYQIAYNLIPQIGGFDEHGYSSEEMKMQNEGRKILHHPDLKVTCTCIRIPVYRSHSESITLSFQQEIDVAKARDLLSDAEGVKLMDNPNEQIYPMPLDTTDQDLVYVGRIRKDLSRDDNKSLTLWCCGDQVRKGAATNAVQIAMKYIELVK